MRNTAHKKLGLIALLALTLVGAPIASAFNMRAGSHEMADAGLHCMVPGADVTAGGCEAESHVEHHSGHDEICLDDCAACISAVMLEVGTVLVPAVPPQQDTFLSFRVTRPGRVTPPSERPPNIS